MKKLNAVIAWENYDGTRLIIYISKGGKNRSDDRHFNVQSFSDLSAGANYAEKLAEFLGVPFLHRKTFRAVGE